MGFKAEYKGSMPEDILKAFDQRKKSMPAKIANTAVNHFKEGFVKGGGQTNKSKGGWKKRKYNKDKGRATLVKSGDLKRDIKVRETNWNRIVVGTQNVKYASYHNEGTHKLPQREFIGDSKELEKKVEKIIKENLRKAFR